MGQESTARKLIDVSSNNSISSCNIPNDYIGKSFGEFHEYIFSDKGRCIRPLIYLSAAKFI